ncbi:MAG TPA: polysaccharide deacetylase family protein [Cellvibrio sp.]|nr:polysaccharide deacetylase family protein [Cellvibrio sp.]
MSFLSIRNKMPGSLLYGGESLPAPICTVESLNNDCKATVYNRSVCLTFDDGPDPVHTPKILDVLAEHDVRATFFVLGVAAEQHPHLVARMLKEGHAVGNHTYSHRHPWMMSSRDAKQEVARATAIIKRITGNSPLWFRPPFGRLREAMLKQAHQEQMTTVLWSRSIIDWGALGTEAGISQRLDRIKPGDIVLMHDGKREHNRPDITMRCLPVFLEGLAQKSLVACNLNEARWGQRLRER